MGPHSVLAPSGSAFRPVPMVVPGRHVDVKRARRRLLQGFNGFTLANLVELVRRQVQHGAMASLGIAHELRATSWPR